MFHRILIANDGSDGALRALDAALELAVTLKADLCMIGVEEDLPKYAETIGELDDEKEAEESYFQEVGAQARAKAFSRGIELRHAIVAGHEVKAIVEYARQNSFDLLVVGFTGHSRIYEHIWGGTSQNLTRIAPCSVLVIK
ncbi:MAG: universal stress protein [Bryobacteraceae bacterium]|jgi:nucleotide-binding universal stress UspA family protein